MKNIKIKNLLILILVIFNISCDKNSELEPKTGPKYDVIVLDKDDSTTLINIKAYPFEYLGYRYILFLPVTSNSIKASNIVLDPSYNQKPKFNLIDVKINDK